MALADLAPFSYSAATTRILALDIAKRETGYAIIEFPVQPDPEGFFKWIDWGRFKTDVRNDKMMFAVGQEIAMQVAEEVQQIRRAGHNCHIILEHPVFGGTRSEQQYLLFQSVLAVCAEWHVNVTTVSTGFLKAFIRKQVTDLGGFLAKAGAAENAEKVAAGKKAKAFKFGRTLDKDAIRLLYNYQTAPTHPDWPRPEQIGNDDEYDAIYLAALGALFCGDLPDLQIPLIQFSIDNASTVEALYALPYVAQSIFRYVLQFAPPELRLHANHHWPEAALKEVLKDFRKNGHRKPEGKLDYLFNQLALAQLAYQRLVELDPKEALELSKTWGSKRTQLDQHPQAGLSVNYAGQFYCHTPLRRVSSLTAAD